MWSAGCMEEWMPTAAMVATNIVIAVMTALLKQALNQGMNRLVLITSRQMLATVFLGPIAYFKERKTRPKFTGVPPRAGQARPLPGVYGAATDVLHDALDNIRARVYGRAVEQIAAALGAAERCEDAWKGEEQQSRVPAVSAHDREYGRLAVVALGLTAGIA